PPSGSDASWHASYGLPSGGLDQCRSPAPQIIVGQVRAAPPAVDRVVPTEIFLVAENGPAEFGDRQPAAQVGWVPVAQILAVERTQFLVEARHGRSGPKRQPIQQVAVFPLAEDACLPQLTEMEERVRERVSPRDQFKHPHFRSAKPCRT